MVKKWVKRLSLMRVSKYALTISLSSSLVFAGFTVYGARTGNFNIYTQANDLALSIYMKEDKSDLGTHLSVPMLDNMDNTTFEDLASDEIRNRIVPGLGPKNDEVHHQYLAFSFVLVNFSDRMVNYSTDLTVTSSHEGFGGLAVEQAMRVLVLKERGFQNGSEYEALSTYEEQNEYFRNGDIYALPEETEENQQRLEDNTNYKTIDFISDVQLFHQEEYDLEIGEEVKYTVLMWLEGWDADCINALYGGKIKMRLDIAGK